MLLDMDTTASSEHCRLGSAERRSLNDRRRPPGFPPLFRRLRRRRSAGRRTTDGPGYVDIYDRGSWIVAMAVLGMSFLDAAFTTLQLQHRNMREANPLMAMVLSSGGVHAFICVKCALTALPLAIIILHKEWALARFAARLVLLAYALTTAYHLYLLFR
jgi:hypothetical protein